MSASGKEKQQQCIEHIPYYLSDNLSRNNCILA